MASILLFAEDFGHEAFTRPLIERVATECGCAVEIEVRTAVGGRPRLISELRDFISEQRLAVSPLPDLLVVVTDANCRGMTEWRKDITNMMAPLLTERALTSVLLCPDPHVERWMLLDSRAFRAVFGRGCSAPDDKCERDRYKTRLLSELSSAGIDAQFGGMEYSDAIVAEMDLERMLTADPSLGAAIRDLRSQLSLVG